MQLHKLIIPGLIATCLSAPVVADSSTATQLTGASIDKISLVEKKADSHEKQRKHKNVNKHINKHINKNVNKRIAAPNKGTLLTPTKDKGFQIK